MKNILFYLLFILPLVSFGQLGKTPNEIEKSLGKTHSTEFVEGFLKYSYDFQSQLEGKKIIETYTFIFEKINGNFICKSWSVFRPIDALNKTYWELEDYFKVNDAIYLCEVDKSTQDVNLFRGEGYYLINVTNKK